MRMKEARVSSCGARKKRNKKKIGLFEHQLKNEKMSRLKIKMNEFHNTTFSAALLLYGFSNLAAIGTGIWDMVYQYRVVRGTSNW